MKIFEIGKTYGTTSIGNSDCKITLTVKSRTAATITAVDNHGEVKKLRINKKFLTYRNAETVLPWGNYSMCPNDFSRIKTNQGGNTAARNMKGNKMRNLLDELLKIK